MERGVPREAVELVDDDGQRPELTDGPKATGDEAYRSSVQVAVCKGGARSWIPNQMTLSPASGNVTAAVARLAEAVRPRSES